MALNFPIIVTILEYLVLTELIPSRTYLLHKQINPHQKGLVSRA